MRSQLTPIIAIIERLFLVVPWGCLQFVIVVFPHHTHLLLFIKWKYRDVITDYSCGVVHSKQYVKLIANNSQSCIIGEMYIIKRRKKKNVQYHEK